MKKKLFILPLIVLLTGCTTNKESIYPKKISTISYQEFVNIVNDANEDDTNIFFFTVSSCPYCQILSPVLDRYYNNDADDSLHIYKLSLDYSTTSTDRYQYNDKTMGYFSGQDDDCIKILDERIGEFLYETGGLNDEHINVNMETNSSYPYNYIYTPLLVFYKGNYENKVVNSIASLVDEKNKVNYNDFKEMISYNNEVVWEKAFNLIAYNKAEKTARGK